MNKDALRRLYDHVLPLFGLSIGDDDFLNTYSVQQDYTRNYIPMMVAEMGVIYPTDEVLREGKWNDRVAFHPLSESATRGISPMVISMVSAYKFKLLQNIFFATTMFCKLAKDNKDGTVKHISPDLTIALSKLPKTIDDKSVAFISKVIGADNGTDQEVVKVYLKKNGSINGTEFKRTSTIYFPLIEALDAALESKSSVVWGVTAARKTDVQLLRDIMEVILPDCGHNDRYSYGSFAGSAPYFDALLRSVVKVQESLNHALTLMGKHIPDAIRATIFADIDWLDDIVDFKTYRNILGPLRYNEGDMESEDEDPEERSYTRKASTEDDGETPNFSERGKQAQARVNKVTTKPIPGQRRPIDGSLTEEERTSPEDAEYEERRQRRLDERDRGRHNDRDYRDDRGHRDDRYDRRRDDYDDRGRGRDRDYDDRGRGRGRDRDYDDRRSSSWSDRADRRDRDDRRESRGRRGRR